jgi:3-deoxy-D-manno-octulosonic-acid transferase
METEFWPNLHEAAYNLGVPMIIINGRLTNKSLQVPGWLRYLYCRIVQHCQAVIARSQEDQERFASLGARKEKLFQLDNLKYATSEQVDVETIDLGRPYLLAASTRDKEELEVIGAWLQLPVPRPLLVIAPRHPKRLNDILDDIDSYHLSVAIRSRGNPVTDSTDVYLADTLGELANFMAGAKLVFMGGSLVTKGGHNILEPARLGKAIITGPHMDNFRDETELLLEAGGIYQVNNRDELADCLAQLLEHPTQAQRLADNAKAVMAQKSAVVEQYLELLQQLYPLKHQQITPDENVHQLETIIS